MPGITISTAVRTGPTSTTVNNSSQAFFVGIAQRGPTTVANLVSSMQNYEEIYGGYISNAYLHSTVQTFFEEGGSQCFIARALGAGAATAAFNVLDDAGSNQSGSMASVTGAGPWVGTITGMASTTDFNVDDTLTATAGTGTLHGGSPTSVVITSIVSATSLTYTVTGGTTPTVGTLTNISATALVSLVLTANGPGIWANGATGGLTFTVTAGTVTGTRVLKIFYDGTLILNSGNVATNIAMVGKVNNSLVARNYLTATLGASTASLAREVGPTSLASGADGSTPTAAACVTALGLFLDSYGTGAVACPEFTGTNSSTGTVPAALITHANANRRIAILHTLDDSTVAEAQDTAEYITANVADNLEHVALYYPWIFAPSGTPGVNRLIPPDGYVAGARARAHNQVGQHQPGAGVLSVADFVTGIEAQIGKTDSDNLDAAKVNVIRLINNSIRIYGARSLSADEENFRYINAQDLVNFVTVEAENRLEDLLFNVIDGRNSLFAEVEAKLIGIMEPLRIKGAVYEGFSDTGKRLDYGYTVRCNQSINPLQNLANGLVTAQIGLRVSSIGDSIQVNIIKSTLNASV